MPTVGDSMLAHIAQHSPRMIGENVPYVLPFDLTQDGISIALRKGRAHIAIEAKKLMAEGLVNEHLKHISGTNGKRRKTYIITDTGRKKVSANAKMDAETISPGELLKIAVANMQTQLECIENKLANVKANLYALNVKVSL